jgi:hypothetical protein
VTAVRTVAGLALLAAMLLTHGCQTPPGDAASASDAPSSPPPQFFGGSSRERREKDKQAAEYIDAAAVDTSDDIVFVNTYWQPQPWIMESGRIIGMSARTYFVSSASERGVFVSGDILAWVNLIDTDGFGRSARARLVEQRFPQAEALGMRIRKRSLLGYSYGLILTLPDDVPLAGKQVEVQVGYETLDGRLVRSAPRRFRIPASAPPENLEAPPQESVPAGPPASVRRSRPAPAAETE